MTTRTHAARRSPRSAVGSTIRSSTATGTSSSTSRSCATSSSSSAVRRSPSASISWSTVDGSRRCCRPRNAASWRSCGCRGGGSRRATRSIVRPRCCPQLLYERLDQIGIDVAIAYPTYGLTAIHLTDDELRPALSRAFNMYVAEVYAPYRDRILPVACIPTFTPGGGHRRARVRGGGARPARRHDGRRHPAAVPRRRHARARAGWTASVTPRSTTTRRCGRSASSSASRRRSTRRAPVGARARRRPTTCSTTSGTSRRPAS